MTTLVPLERDCEDTIVDAARILGFRVHVERPARTKRGWRTAIKGHPGWPDLVICGHNRLFVVELKRRGNKVTDDQQAWLDTLGAAGVDARVLWLPAGQQPFLDELAQVVRDRWQRQFAGEGAGSVGKPGRVISAIAADHPASATSDPPPHGDAA